MEDLETRKARKVEQVVAKWLRRSRDHSGRGRASVSDGPSDGNKQPATVKLTVEVQKDVLLGHYGIEVSHNLPLLITSVAAGSTADGKLLPGDRILAINNEAAEDITGEQAAALLRESQDTLQFTVLRCTSGGPKSSFLTAEKRARLKTNPVKVHFAEEVFMNGHNQGSSLLCMPNVLKVYLENGQTKAFKFEANTTVKDIILTLKEKLSIRNIEHFALVLEERHNMFKMYLLHEDELIERVVERKESRDYRCLFRVCFIPRDPLHLLQQDPVAFEYLYLQSCSDVLRERFAVEMKCSVALRLSALHIQERIITCAQPQKISLKYIEKDWGIENFISPTLLRNMRGKDIKKAISFHMKRNQLLLDPRQKHHLSAAQVRLCYLQILGDLKLYGGKVFNVTLMLQDRESCIALLVGAKYGISQVVNSKLNVVAILAEFANISRLELTKESDKVSMVKIYLQDIKKKRKKEKEPLYQVLTVLLESNSAKDLACLISGYYRMFVDSSNSIFIWGERKRQMHRFSAEEGYESRTCSDSEESSEPDSSLDHFSDTQSPKYSSISPPIEEEGEQQGLEQEKRNLEAKGMSFCNGYNMSDSLSEASDSANTESRGLKSSGSSDSLDALEEDDLEACSASRPEVFQFCPSALQKLASNDKMLFGADGDEGSRTLQENFFPFLLPPLELPQPEEESRRENGVSTLESKLAESNTMEYYSLCANLSPDSSAGKNTQSDSPESCSLQEPEDHERISEGQAYIFDNTRSDDNFCDATEGMAPTEPQAGSGVLSPDCSPELPSCGSLDENILARQSRRMKPRPAKEPTTTNNLRKRRSFLQTNYTSQVSFPKASPHALKNIECCNTDSTISGASYSPAMTLLKEPQQVSNLLEATEQIQMAQNSTSSSDSTEMGQNSSVPNSVLCLVSAQADGESLDSTRHSLNYFNMPTYQSCCLSTPGLTFHLEDLNPTCKEKPEKLTEIPSGIQGHCEIKAECSVNQALDKKVNTIKAVSPTGVSYVLIEEIIHTTTKPSGSQSSIQDKPLSYASHLDQDPLPAEEVEKQEQVMLEPCKRVKSDPILYESSQALGDLKLEEGISQLSSKGATQKSGDEKHLGYSNVTELFFNCSDKSGSETCCWPDSSSAVKNAEICQQADNECQGITGQNVLSINHLSLKDGVLNRVLACLSATSMSQNLCQSADVAGDYKTEGKNLTGDALIMDYKKKRPSSLMASSEEYIEQSKTDNLPGQGYCSCDMLSKAARSSEKKCTSDLPFLPSDNATRDAMAFNDTGPPGVVNSEETFTPEPKLERCSCQLSYASCFHGVENEAELDCTKPLASSMSEGPLTTPPSTRNPLPSDFNPTRHLQEHNYRDGIPRDSQHHKCLPELPIKELSYMKEKWSVLPFDFCHLLGNVVELQEMLRWFSGNQKNHPEDKCSALFSENKNALYSESQRLLSNCQKIIKAHGPSPETQIIIQVTFQNLLQLTEVCLQFTNCGLCSSGHIDLKANLRDVLCNYQRFLEACRQTHEKDYSSLSLKLRVCEYTALAASLFCLVRQFRASSST